MSDSGAYSSLGPSHAWGQRDAKGIQQCSACQVYKMTAGGGTLIYYSREKSLTGTWSVMRPPCRRSEAAA